MAARRSGSRIARIASDHRRPGEQSEGDPGDGVDNGKGGSKQQTDFGIADEQIAPDGIDEQAEYLAVRVRQDRGADQDRDDRPGVGAPRVTRIVVRRKRAAHVVRTYTPHPLRPSAAGWSRSG